MRTVTMSDAGTVRNQDVVCVLGMHRSGTSLLTRALNLLGLHLGSDDALTTERAAYNPKGHWEHKEITSICNAILKRHGGSWGDPPLFPRGWETAAALDDLKHHATRLIDEQFGEVQQWGWKDPRTCITLPFWQQLLPTMRYIICLRNPVDVSLSLAHRDRFSAEKSSFLWFTYVCSALTHTVGKPRLIIFYDDLLDDCLGELQRLADFLGNPELANQLGVQESVSEFVEKGLQHYRTSLIEASVGSMIDLYARALYVAQRISVSFDHNDFRAQRPLDHQTHEALNTLVRYLSPTSSHPRQPSAEVTEGVSKPPGDQDGTLFRQLTEITRALQSQSQSVGQMVRELSAQLLHIQTQLPRVRDTFGRRLLTHYTHTKSYLLPIYSAVRSSFRQSPPS